MTTSNALVPMSEVLDSLSLTDLCRISGCSADWIIELVQEGILEPESTGHRGGGAVSEGSSWTFESSSITLVHKVRRLQADLRLNLPGAALVLSLVDENTQLRRQVEQLENDPPDAIWMPAP